MYHLNDLEEDDENDRVPWLDNTKGQDEIKTGEEVEDEGITFNVHSSSTPDGRKERSVYMPFKAPPLSPPVRASPVSMAAAVTFDTLVKSAAGSTALPVCQTSLSVTTTTSSIGKSFNINAVLQHCHSEFSLLTGDMSSVTAALMVFITILMIVSVVTTY